MDKIEIDFLVNLVVDFNNTKNVDEIYELLKEQDLDINQEISKFQIKRVLKERTYNDPKKLTLYNFFK